MQDRVPYCVSEHEAAGGFGDSLAPFPSFPVLYVKELETIKHRLGSLANGRIKNLKLKIGRGTMLTAGETA